MHDDLDSFKEDNISLGWTIFDLTFSQFCAL